MPGAAASTGASRVLLAACAVPFTYRRRALCDAHRGARACGTASARSPACSRYGSRTARSARPSSQPRRHAAARLGLDAVVGALGGILSGLFSVGGAVFAVPFLSLVFAYTQTEAQGLSLALVAPGTDRRHRHVRAGGRRRLVHRHPARGRRNGVRALRRRARAPAAGAPAPAAVLRVCSPPRRSVCSAGDRERDRSRARFAQRGVLRGVRLNDRDVLERIALGRIRDREVQLRDRPGPSHEQRVGARWTVVVMSS